MMHLIEQVKNRIRLLVGRALIQAVNSASGDDGLSVDISLPGGEKHSKVPLFQQYGISSKPNKDSEAVIVFIGGARDNGVAIATQGAASKLPSLKDGEVAIFSEYGQTIILKEDGSIVATPKSGQVYRIESDVEVTGDLKVLCDSTFITMQNHIHMTGVGVSATPQKGI